MPAAASARENLGPAERVVDAVTRYADHMLVQGRKGEPVREGGVVAFLDEDYRDVGEAMMLLALKDRDLDAKHLLRIREVLEVPAVADLNRSLGFGQSERRAPLGRWEG